MKKRILILAGIVLLMTACGDTTTPADETPTVSDPTDETTTVDDPADETTTETKEATVTITDAPETLAPGEAYKITVETTDVEEGVELEMTSSDEAVATIDEDGLITAVADGTTTVTVAAGEVTDTVELTVSSTLPNARTVLTNVINTRNYTIDVTRDGEPFEELVYTDTAVNLNYIDGDSAKYAVSAVDGIAFEYEIEDGGIVAGEQVADLGGYVTAETFHGNANNPYYSPIVGLGAISIENIDEEGEDDVYTLSLWNSASDRDTYNRYLFIFMSDYATYSLLNTRVGSVVITVTGYYSFEVDITARLATESSNHTYHMDITDLTTTTIDDGIDEFIKTHTGETRDVPEELLGSFEQLTTYDNYVIGDGYSYTYTLTEDYCWYETSDEYVKYFLEYPEYYSAYATDSSGYIKLDDGIYELSQAVTVDDQGTVTRGDIVVGSKVEGTDASTSLPELMCYFSTWEALKDPYVYVDSTKFMTATTLGYASGDPVTAEDSYQRALVLFPLWAFEPYGAIDDLYCGYRTHVIPTNRSENPAESVVSVIVGYQATTTQKDLSSGYSYYQYTITSFGEASVAALEALL